LLGDGSAAPVAFFADVPGAGAGTVDADGLMKSRFAHKVAHDRLGGGRTTDVAHAHEADSDANGGLFVAGFGVGHRAFSLGSGLP
jgi:hypothetical protein